MDGVVKVLKVKRLTFVVNPHAGLQKRVQGLNIARVPVVGGSVYATALCRPGRRVLSESLWQAVEALCGHEETLDELHHTDEHPVLAASDLSDDCDEVVVTKVASALATPPISPPATIERPFVPSANTSSTVAEPASCTDHFLVSVKEAQPFLGAHSHTLDYIRAQTHAQIVCSRADPINGKSMLRVTLTGPKESVQRGKRMMLGFMTNAPIMK